MTTIVGIAGSLRAGSYNKKVLAAVATHMPEGVSFTELDISSLPMFSEDLEGSVPEAVTAFKTAIEQADAILIATPEYNRSVPGALKNAIDWASRPYGHNSFAGKIVATMGATQGTLGTAVAQSHLRQILVYLDAQVIGQPEVYISSVQDKCDDTGALTDAGTHDVLERLVKKVIEKIG